MKNKPEEVKRIDTQSPDLRQEVLNKFKKLYPPLFDNEGLLNQDELDQLVKDFSTPQTEKYEFSWAGKQQAKKKAFTRSKATLRSETKRSVDFDNTENLIIEGDNLEVLKLLQKSYFGKIKCIYIDPPYNTGNDFIYSDDYSEDKQAYWEKSGVKQAGVKLDTNTDSSGRYHSNWLSMMQPRLLLSRNLLKQDGVILVSISDIEQANLKKLLDEIFGEENFIGQLIWKNKHGGGGDNPYLVAEHEYILMFAKDLNELAKLFVSPPPHYEKMFRYQDEKGKYYLDRLDKKGIESDRPNLIYPIKCPDGTIKDISPQIWRLSKEEFLSRKNAGYVEFKKDKNDEWQIYTKTYLFEENGDRRRVKPRSILKQEVVGFTQDGNKEMESIFGKRLFPNPKPSRLIKHILDIMVFEDKESIVLDFFAGSGTTAHAVIDLNKEDDGKRKFILVQIPEATDEKSEAFKAGYKTISDICIERVKRAGKKLKEGTKDLDVGFKVFKLATSHFPENTFAPDPDKSDEQNKKALEEYIKKAISQKSLFRDGVTDLVYEIALKDGFELTLKMEKVKEFDKNTVYRVTDNHKEALVCVDDSLEDATIRQLEKHKDSRFICLHTSVNTTKKWNAQNLLGSNLWLV